MTFLGLDIGELHLKASPDAEIAALEAFGNDCGQWSRGLNWWVGDLYRIAERRLGDNASQVFPEWLSPGYIARCKGVAAAYKPEERNALATWAIHMQNSSRPDRIQRVQAHVDAGRTTDEAQQADRSERANENRPRWILCVDCNYYLHRFWHSGAGVEAATGVASWIERTVGRLKEKGLTDVVCCFDSHENHRKELTAEAGWDDRYKDRPPKDPELSQQLNIVRDLLDKLGYATVSVGGMEADDVMASFADRFDVGKVTLMTQDKDLRQCLSSKCNILLDVEWTQDETSGEHLPEYIWLSAKQHTEETGISPSQWSEYQCIMGDNVDGIRGVEGVGKIGAALLLQKYGAIEAAIEAAKKGDEWLKPKQRESLIAFEDKLSITRQLVTLRTDISVSANTRI